MTEGDIAPDNVPFLMEKDEDKPGDFSAKERPLQAQESITARLIMMKTDRSLFTNLPLSPPRSYNIP